MSKNSFKMLAPKDIAAVLNMIGVHPVVTVEAIEKPTTEIALCFFQNLAEFAYDMDVQQVKAQMPSVVQQWGQQHAEIYDEAMDVLTVFRLSRQLTLINLVEDFNLKDIWEPTPKRFRQLLSAIINFARYKEGKVTLITALKEDLAALDLQRVEQVEASSRLEQELLAAQERHNQELSDMRCAEIEVQRVQAEVDKLQRQQISADRVIEEAEAKLASAKERLQQHNDVKEKLLEHVASLQDQIAESPEGLEQEIGELQDAVRRERSRLEERTSEKRARLQRDQVLGKLGEGLEGVWEELARLRQLADAAAAARERSDAAREELRHLRQLVEARRADEAEMEQRVRQIAVEQERAKQVHEERIKEFETRRQHTLVQHQQLQDQRAEEQKQQHFLQTQRIELEAEVASARRVHEAEVVELHERQHAIHARAEAYVQFVDALMLRTGGDGGCTRAGSPDKVRLRHRVACSPSPARVSANPLGFMSPSALY